MSHVNYRTMQQRKHGGFRALTAIMADLITANIDAGQLASVTGGKLLSGSGAAVFSGMSIDSRTLSPGNLFFAIRGPKNDGHHYIDDAMRRGAQGIVVDAQYQAPEIFPRDRILLQVSDTHGALKDLAAEVRRRWGGILIGITGSMGKTTAKEFAAHVLQTQYGVYRSPGNYNNLFGLPLAIFGLSADDEIGIFEMGMSGRGEIAAMCRIAHPDIGIITNVAAVHLEFFASVEEIALAKGELAEALPREGTLIYNADDPLVRGIAAGFSGNTISFGMTAKAEISVDRVEIVGLQETRFLLSCAGSVRPAMIPLSGSHYVLNALPAIALGNHYGLSLELMVESLRHLRQAPMRGQVLHFREKFSVIDDSYNSNPRALMQMIETLFRSPSYSRRILVAGEMLELGSESPLLHYRCGAWAARQGVDVLVAVQGAAREIARGAAEAGMPSSKIYFFTEVNPASDFVANNVRAGDLVLVKGSRAVRLDKMIQALRSQHVENVI